MKTHFENVIEILTSRLNCHPSNEANIQVREAIKYLAQKLDEIESLLPK